MTNEDYNGYTNRETWALALHIDNDQSLSSIVEDAVSEIMQDDTYDVKSYQVAQYLQDFVDQVKAWRFEDGHVNFLLVSMMDDIGSDYRINYRELADQYIATYNENNKE